MKMRRGVNPNGTVHCGQAMTSISTDCCRPRATSLFLGRNMLLPKTSDAIVAAHSSSARSLSARF